MVFLSREAVEYLKGIMGVAHNSKRDFLFNERVWRRAIQICRAKNNGQGDITLVKEHLVQAYQEWCRKDGRC